MFSNLAGSYTSTAQLVVSLASAFLAYGIYKISTFIYDKVTSPLRYVPGPSSPSRIFGNFKQLSESVSLKSSYYLTVSMITS